MKEIYLVDVENKELIFSITNKGIIALSECTFIENEKEIRIKFDVEKFLLKRNFKKIIKILDK